MSALAAPTVAGPRPPDLLGTLSLRRNETISGLIHRIYGSYSNKNFRAIILANPQIEDPDRVEAGHPIRFPAIPAVVAPPNVTAHAAPITPWRATIARICASSNWRGCGTNARQLE